MSVTSVALIVGLATAVVVGGLALWAGYVWGKNAGKDEQKQIDQAAALEAITTQRDYYRKKYESLSDDDDGDGDDGEDNEVDYNH